ncbi:hypothetical protein MTO96_002576 [Rhipicephalus appendiculatus]
MGDQPAVLSVPLKLCVLLLLFTRWTPTKCASDVQEQAQMTTCELIRFFGFSCETTEATTDDGYILEVDRVGLIAQDNGTSSTENSTKRNPIIMVSGILSESGSWFVNFPSQSAGFLLAQRGYDVWTMNAREIIHRSRHKTLSKKDDRYWQWRQAITTLKLSNICFDISSAMRENSHERCFDEIGRYDIAAVIDLVLNVTGASKVNMLVFSQGMTASLVLLSTRPEYNEKVNLLFAYGPVANVSHVGYPLRELMLFADPLLFLVDPLGDSGYLFIPDAPKEVTQFVCSILKGQPCSLVLLFTELISSEQLNKINRAKDLLMYDHGTSENRKRYGQDEPPAYNVDRITAKIALFSSEGDTVADPIDVSLLAERLGSNLLFKYVVSPEGFRHLDFCWGYQANDIVHNLMLDTLENALISPPGRLL